MLTLYHHHESVCSIKVRLCLEEKGLAWQGVIVDLFRFEQASPWYTKLNPLGVVPTLDDDGAIVVESSFINEYLDEVWPQTPLRPSSPVARARMRFWVKQEDDVLHPMIRPATFNLMIKPLVSRFSDVELNALLEGHPNPERAEDFKRAARMPIDHDAIEASKAPLARSLDLMDSGLSEQPWLAGAHYSLADIACAPIMDRIDRLGWNELIATRRGIRRWWKAVRERPAFARALPPRELRILAA